MSQPTPDRRRRHSFHRVNFEAFYWPLLDYYWVVDFGSSLYLVCNCHRHGYFAQSLQASKPILVF